MTDAWFTCGMEMKALKGERAHMSIQDEPHSTRKLHATWQHQTSQAGRDRTSVCNTKPGIWILGVAELES